MFVRLPDIGHPKEALLQEGSVIRNVQDRCTCIVTPTSVSSATLKVYGSPNYDSNNPAHVADPTLADWCALPSTNLAGTDVARNALITPVNTVPILFSCAGFPHIRIVEQDSGTVTLQVRATSFTIAELLAAGSDPSVGGGLSLFYSADLDETEEAVKATAGAIYFIRYANRSAAEVFIKFYNATVANVTVGTTAPVDVWSLKAGERGHVAIPQGWTFDTAITVAATTDLAEDGSPGAPAANDVMLSLRYA